VTVELLEPDTVASRPIEQRPRAWLAAWLGVVTVGSGWGAWLNTHNVNIVLSAPPLLANLRGTPTLWILVPLAGAPVLVSALPIVAERLRWRSMLLATIAASVLWSVALALGDGPGGLTKGVADRTDYLHDVPWVRAHAGTFLSHFVQNITRFEIQVRGHPPGMVLLLAGMAAVGLHGPGWEAALVIAAGASATVAALIAVRDLAGESWARRAMPWLVIAPAAIFIASSADAFYMALSAWSVSLVVLATRRRGRTGHTRALTGGVIGGLALICSYGAVLAALPAAFVAWRRSRTDCLVLAGAGALFVLGVFARLGFSWPDGVRATLHQYHALPITRPYGYFLVNNVSAWALALGPAMAVAIARLKDQRIWLLVAGALTAAAIADASGLSRGEVERIWLPFTLWIYVAGASLTTTRRSTRTWLTVQAASAIAIVTLLRTQW
jgi:hypothetical protein